MQKALIKREMEKQERSYAWLAKQVKVQPASKQNVIDWLTKSTTPRNVRVFGDMATALGIDVTDPELPVGFKPPVLRYAGEVPAGDWGDPLASEDFREVKDIRWEHNRRFLTTIVGTSCYPFLQPADLCLWHLDPDPNYQVFVLAQRKGDHGCTVKELVRDEARQRPILHSPNSDHGDAEDGEGWGVIARLVGVEFIHEGTLLSAYEETGITKKKLAFRKKILSDL